MKREYDALLEKALKDIDIEKIVRDKAEACITGIVNDKFGHNGELKDILEEKLSVELVAGLKKISLPNFSEIALSAVGAALSDVVAAESSTIRERAGKLILKMLGTSTEPLVGREVAEAFVLEMYEDHFSHRVDECTVGELNTDDAEDVLEIIHEEGGDIDIRLIETARDWGTWTSHDHALVFSVEERGKLQSQIVVTLWRDRLSGEEWKEGEKHNPKSKNIYKIRGVMADGKNIFEDGTVILKDIRDGTTNKIAGAYLADAMIDLTDLDGVIEFERLEEDKR